MKFLLTKSKALSKKGFWKLKHPRDKSGKNLFLKYYIVVQRHGVEFTAVKIKLKPESELDFYMKQKSQ